MDSALFTSDLSGRLANLDRFKDCRDNLTYEHTAVFYNYDGLHYHGRKLSWLSNVPRKHNDTRWSDNEDERIYAIGVGDVHQLSLLAMRYFTLIRTTPGNASADVGKLLGEHGHRQPGVCFSTWCMYQLNHEFIIDAWKLDEVPGARNWTH